MRVAGRLAAQVLAMIRPHVVDGVTTGELDRLCHDYIVNTLDAIPAPLNYRGFPKSICTSVNHVVCHGIPGEKRLKDGDIINIDVTVIKEGYHGDTSRMFFVGTPALRAKRLVEVCHECMHMGIRSRPAGCSARGLGVRDSAARGNAWFFRRARILRAWDRPGISRGAPGTALREPGHRVAAGAGYDFYHRTDDQCRETPR